MIFERKHIISTKDFSRGEIDLILERAAKLEPFARDRAPGPSCQAPGPSCQAPGPSCQAPGPSCQAPGPLYQGGAGILKDRIVALLFYEPSTRTRLSFDAAVKRLGGTTVGFDAAMGSSAAKGETLADTIRMVESYADAIVLRHPREGAARMASEISSVPVINAGDGAGHHPTQTLLDLYTMKKECAGKDLGDLHVAIVGDLKYGRTVHSLSYALSLYGARFSFVSPEQLKMPPSIISYLKKKNIQLTETPNLQDALNEADVLYMTRIQKERFPDPGEYLKVAGSYRIAPEMLKGVKNDMIIMHPLPRVDEIDPAVDGTKYARYFKQSFYGVPVRMAVLSLVMGVED